MKFCVNTIIFLLCAYTIGYAQQNKQDSVKKSNAQKPAAAGKTKPSSGSNDNAVKLPVSAEDYYKLGVFKHDMNDYNGAIADYNKAIEIDPEYSHTYISRGDIFFIRQDFNSALYDFAKSVELTEKQIDVLSKAANVKYVLGDYKGSSQDNNSLSLLKTLLAEALYKRGHVKHLSGDTTGGCEDLIKAGEMGHSRAFNFIKKLCQ